MDVEEGVPELGRYWKVMPFSPTEARNEKKADTARQRILDAMLDFPNGQTKTSLLEAAKVRSNSTAKEVLDALVRDNTLVQGMVKKGVGSYPGYLMAV